MKRLAVAVLVAALVLVAGCVSDQARNLIQVGAAVGDGDLAEWDRLTDEERYVAHWGLVRAFHALDLEVNGVPLPAEFVSVAEDSGGAR